MELVEVEIIGMVITARYGTLNTGDLLRTDAEFAKHLVDDCSAAKYPKPRTAATPVAPEIKSPRKKRDKPVDVALQTDTALDTTENAAVDMPDALPYASSESAAPIGSDSIENS